MKKLLFILSICLSFFVNGQDVKLVKPVITCETGVEKAMVDFNKGHYEVYSFGMMTTSNDDGFNEFYKNYILEKYDVLLIHKGDIIMPDDTCYSVKMQELLSEKFGNNIFNIAYNEARAEFENNEITKKGICFQSKKEATTHILGDWKLKDKASDVTYRFGLEKEEVRSHILLNLDYYNNDKKEELRIASNESIEILDFQDCFNVGIENNEYKFGGIFYDFVFISKNEFTFNDEVFVRVED